MFAGLKSYIDAGDYRARNVNAADPRVCQDGEIRSWLVSAQDRMDICYACTAPVAGVRVV